MKDLFKVTYEIVDRGIQYPATQMEVAVKKGESVDATLKTNLNKYRHAMDLSRKFAVTVVEKNHIGYSS
jgi:hypothetical protein